jgi:PAS domain S-box-containing protein
MNNQKNILYWLIWLDTSISTFSLFLGFSLGSSWINLLTLIPIFINLSCLYLTKINKFDFASTMAILSIVLSIYCVDTTLYTNLGTFLFYFPAVIGIYLFDALGTKRIKPVGLSAILLSIILVNFELSPKLIFSEIAGIYGTQQVFTYNIFISALSSIIALNLFSKIRKEAEAELEINQANNLALLENSNDAIWSVDTHYKIVSFNKRFDQLYQELWCAKATQGTSILFQEEKNNTFKKWNAAYKRAIEGEKFSFEIEYDLGESIVFFEISFMPILKGNQIHGTVVKALDITQRKLALQEQQLISQNLELLLSSTQEIIFEMDANDKCVKVWKGENLNMHYPDEYFVGKSIEQLFDIPFHIHLNEPYLQTKQTGTAHEYEYSYTLKGTTKHYLAKLRRIKNSNPPKVSIVIEDITRRKEAEFKQTQQSIFLNKLIAHLPIGVFVKNVQNNLTYTLWNKELETLFGFKESEVIGKTDEEIFIHAGEISNYLATDKWVMEEKEPILIQKLAIQVENKQIYARTFKIPILDSNGEVESILGILENITDVVSSQEELAKAEKRWNYALSGSRDAVWDVNLITKETFYSAVFNEMLGFKAFEILPYAWEDLVHPEDLSKAWNLFVEHLEGKSHFYECEYRLRRKDGSYFWVLDRGKLAETNEEGTPIRIIGTFTNIDYRKRLEEEYKIALQKAQEASKAKSLFLSTMSHEIRTPMNGVIGIISLLLKDNPKQEQLENLNALKYSADNLLFLLNDILDFNKIDAGKLDLEEHNFNLYDCLQNTSKSFASTAKAKNVGLKLEASNNFPKAVIGDSMRLNQVLNNLLSNAIKFTEKGEVGLSAKAEEITNDWIRITFRVWDTGIGIEDEYLPKIFEHFTQASSDTTRKYGGSGLGLAICHRLVNILGGDLKVRSVLGEGTQFWFTLDFRIAANQGKSNEKSDETQNEAFPGMHVLLVEDNQMNVFVAKQFLTRWQILVDVANNGKEALLAVQRKNYHLILMDLQMPEMDGFESASLMRKAGINTPIFALSANVNIDAREKVLEHGMNDYITKPFNPNELLEKIDAIYKPAKKAKNNTNPNQTLF